MRQELAAPTAPEESPFPWVHLTVEETAANEGRAYSEPFGQQLGYTAFRESDPRLASTIQKESPKQTVEDGKSKTDIGWDFDRND